MESNNKTVTVKEQRAHIRKIKKLVSFLNNAQRNPDGRLIIALTPDEVDTIQRALACHLCVITLDMKERKKREKEALDEVKQKGISGKD